MQRTQVINHEVYGTNTSIELLVSHNHLNKDNYNLASVEEMVYSLGLGPSA